MKLDGRNSNQYFMCAQLIRVACLCCRDIQSVAGAGAGQDDYERLKRRLYEAQQKLDKVLSEKSETQDMAPLGTDRRKISFNTKLFEHTQTTQPQMSRNKLRYTGWPSELFLPP